MEQLTIIAPDIDAEIGRNRRRAARAYGKQHWDELNALNDEWYELTLEHERVTGVEFAPYRIR